MPKPKPTAGDHLRFITIMQLLMEEYEAHGLLPYETEGVQALFAKEYQRYNKKADAVLQPKPRKPKPTQASGKAAGSTVHFEPDAYENSNPKTGRMKS